MQEGRRLQARADAIQATRRNLAMDPAERATAQREEAARHIEEGTLVMGRASGVAPVIRKFKGDTGRVLIGNFVSIAEGVEFYSGGLHRTEWVSQYGLRAMLELPGAYEDGFPHGRGDTHVGHDVSLADGVIVMSGVTIGSRRGHHDALGRHEGRRPIRDRGRRSRQAHRPALRRRADRGAAADRLVGLAGRDDPRARGPAVEPRRRRVHRRVRPRARGMTASGVAVVIVNFNGERLLPDCLAALRAQTLAPDEIVVADNGSQRRLARAAARAPPRRPHRAARPQLRLRRRRQPRRGGDGQAPWVCVLNSDATPQPDWLALLMAAPRDERRTWALGSVLVSAKTGRIESAGDQYDPRGFAYKLLRDRPLSDLPSEPYRVFAAPGAAPVFRRDVFDRLGGYEERFFLYYEDVDLAFRAVLLGYHALLVPDARVVHRLGATTKSLARARFYVARNSIWCAVRCLPEARPSRLARRWASELRTNRPRRLIGVELAGRAAGLAGLPRALRERREIQDAARAGPRRAGADAAPRPPHRSSAARNGTGMRGSVSFSRR